MVVEVKPKVAGKEVKERKPEKKPVCDICGEPSVVNESDGHRYCLAHLTQFRRCKAFEKIKREHETSMDRGTGHE